MALTNFIMKGLLFETILHEQITVKDENLKKIYRFLLQKLHDDHEGNKNLYKKYCPDNITDDDYYKLLINGIKSDLEQYSEEILPYLKAYEEEHGKEQPKQDPPKLDSKTLREIFLRSEDKLGNFKTTFFQGRVYNAVAFENNSKCFVVSANDASNVVYFTFVKSKKDLNTYDLRTAQGKELQQKLAEELNLLNTKKQAVLTEINASIAQRSKNPILEQHKDSDEPRTVIATINDCLKGNMSIYKLNDNFNKELAKAVGTTLNIQKNYARHPYADQVVKAMEDNMTGNKYIKVGNQAYKEAFEYYKKAAMSILKTLREADATVSLADLRDVSDSKIKDGVNLVDRIYKTPSNQKWESRDFLDAVQAAREGDQTAIGFLMYKHAPMIINTYWRNFLGPNPKMRKVRIEEDGGLKSSILGWIGICLKALIKGGVDITKKNGSERHKFSTLEGFDESKVTGKPENAFASHFRMDVIEQAKVYNTMNDANGVSNADTPVSMTDLEFDNGRERTDGEDDAFAREGLEDSVLDKLSKDDFLKNWFDYAQDETLNDGKKCTPAAALWKLLTNPDATNLKAVAEEMGVSRGTFETLVKKAISIMPQYDIEYSDLMSACDRYGTAKIASYLAH